MDTLSILIVEDSDAQRKHLAQQCQDMGCKFVAEAENGRVALELIENSDNHFDILVCDLEMPDIDGIELINLLGNRITELALIIVSAREKSLISSVELMASKQGIWVLGSVQKPLSYNKLKQLMKHYLTYKNEQGEVVRPARKPKLSVEEVKQALDLKLLELHYQPKINMKDHSLAGVECLVRIKKDDQVIFPDQFISVCEEHNLIDDLSYRVVAQAVLQKLKWNGLGLKTQWSINLSAVSFENETFCEALMEVIKSMQGAASQLIFEVTETAVIKDMGKALGVLNRLRLAGCGLSLDDYGTGYSSIQQLSQIPFTELKMDRSLIDGISSKPHLQVIFASSLAMCNQLGLKMVAEGIESKEDWEYLKRRGCHMGQGYYYAPPMPEKAFLEWHRHGMLPLG
ncbi:EAL domain-containing protein [Litoribrevibacter euphylliae]|uniref:EAL domain-containing protein n=1 Tax=Litoribrevibacter euphylliae TaxID=1834034 RepID=A0ABV7HBL2_9GAMM